MRPAEIDQGITCGAKADHRSGGSAASLTTKQIRLAIVDSNQLFREGLRHLLRRPRFAVVATAPTLAEAVSDAGVSDRLDLVICGLNGDEEAEALLASVRERAANSSVPRFVFLVAAPTPDFIRQAVASGVDALLSKNISSEVLHCSIELVMLGQRLFPVSLAQTLGRDASATSPAPPDPAPALPSDLSAAVARLDVPKPAARLELAASDRRRSVMLSEREDQILRCLIRGLSNKGIARELTMAEATVKVHVKGLLRKIGAQNRTQAAIWALNNNYASEPLPGHAAALSAVSRSDQRPSA